MKTFIFLVFTTAFGFTPNNILSQNSKVIISVDKEATVDEVFQIISNQTDYRFIYQADLFLNSPKVMLKKGVVKTQTLLDKALSNGDFDVSFTPNNMIIIKESFSKSVQEAEISGTVVDKNGVPIPGASILVSSNSPTGQEIPRDFVLRGTVADFDGNFSTKAEVGHYLIVSALGYEVFSQQITAQTEYNIVLKERASILDEVVVVGYGSQRREEVSSAISSLKGEKVVQTVIGNASFDRGLSGLIKGVQIQQTSARPGAGVDINIRGFTSPFTGSDNNPLFVIDGVPFQVNPNATFNDETQFLTPANPLLTINPNDIESIDVLKDAAATSIYGSRGANGVVIVNTRRGKQGEKMQVSVSTQTTFGEPIGTLDYINAEEFIEFTDAYALGTVEASNAGQLPIPAFLTLGFGIANVTPVFDPITFGFTTQYDGLNPDFFGDADTDWNEVVYRNTAVTNRYDVNITGGGAKSSYLLSLGYLDQEGLLRNDELKQYNLRFGLDSNVNDAIRIGVSANLSYSDNFSGFGTINNTLNALLNTRPDFAPRDEEGNFNFPAARFVGLFDLLSPNPLALTTENSVDIDSYNVLGNVYADVEVVKNLRVRGQLNGSFFFTDNNTFTPAFATQFGAVIGPGFPTNQLSSENSTSNISRVINSSIITDVTATYANNFGKHNLSALAGLSWQRDVNDRNVVALEGFPDDDVLTTITNGTRLTTSSASIVEVGLNSLFGRVSYNYGNKYFANVSLRRDTSSRFGPNNRSAFFPAVSASWNITGENFLKNSNTVNNLKLRASIGEVGSVNIGDFRFVQFFEQGSRSDSFYNGDPAIGLNDVLVNEDIRWETTRDINLGLDFGFFNNRLYGSVDVYDRQTEDALFVNPPFPRESGATSFTANFANLTNRGFEIEIAGDVIKTKNFRWALGFNIAKNDAELDEFNSETLNAAEFDRFEIGSEPGLIRGHVVEGIFQNQSEVDELNAAAIASGNGVFYQAPGTSAGDYRFQDVNGDGVINDDDLVVLGSPQADFFGGFNTLFQYKGFELSAIFNFVEGTESLIGSGLSNPLYPEFGFNVERQFSTPFRWSPTNTGATLPRLVAGDPNLNSRVSSANVFDSSYLRLRNVQLKYNFPAQPLEKIGLNSLSVFVAGTNLWTSTDFPGIDPAGAGGIGSDQFGTNRNSYPDARSWSLGLNVNF